MSVKSDRWIRRMAVEHGMIEPFSPTQVRERTDENGREVRVISYGISSYGYDLRVSSSRYSQMCTVRLSIRSSLIIAPL